jgi:hypothetical protein
VANPQQLLKYLFKWKGTCCDCATRGILCRLQEVSPFHATVRSLPALSTLQLMTPEIWLLVWLPAVYVVCMLTSC